MVEKWAKWVGETNANDYEDVAKKNKRKQQKVAEALKSQSIYSVSSTVIVV